MWRHAPQGAGVIAVPGNLAQFHQPLADVIVLLRDAEVRGAQLCTAAETLIDGKLGHGWNIGFSRPGLKIALAAPFAAFDGELFKTVNRNQLCAWMADHQLEAARSPLGDRFERVEVRDQVRVGSSLEGRSSEISGVYVTPTHTNRRSGSHSDAGSDVAQ